MSSIESFKKKNHQPIFLIFFSHFSLCSIEKIFAGCSTFLSFDFNFILLKEYRGCTGKGGREKIESLLRVNAKFYNKKLLFNGEKSFGLRAPLKSLSLEGVDSFLLDLFLTFFY